MSAPAAMGDGARRHAASVDRLGTLNALLAGEINDVKGWCDPALWQTLWPLAEAIGPGPIAEIGVFEGKFFIGLCKTFTDTLAHSAVAIDVFDMQEFNLDKAGVGKRDVFAENLDRHGLDPAAVTMQQVDSLSLRPRDAEAFLAQHGPAAFFSVDGCHEVLHTVNDAEFAMQVTDHRGVIAIDDYTNQHWPGVHEAVARMYLMGTPRFVPLAITCNKLLLCTLSYQKSYRLLLRDYVRANHPTTSVKPVKLYGYDVLSVRPNPKHPTQLVAIN